MFLLPRQEPQNILYGSDKTKRPRRRCYNFACIRYPPPLEQRRSCETDSFCFKERSDDRPADFSCHIDLTTCALTYAGAYAASLKRAFVLTKFMSPHWRVLHSPHESRDHHVRRPRCAHHEAHARPRSNTVVKEE